MMTRSAYQNRRGSRPWEDFSQDMEKVFDSLLGCTVDTMLRKGANEKYVPALDISEKDDAFAIQLDLPGVNPDDVKIEMHDGKLTIAGSRVTTVEEKDTKYHRAERSSGSFHRAISLPGDVDVDNIDASYQHGVLHIKLPKIVKPQPKKIQIRTDG